MEINWRIVMAGMAGAQRAFVNRGWKVVFGTTADDDLVPAREKRERRLTSTRRLEKRRQKGGNRDRLPR